MNLIPVTLKPTPLQSTSLQHTKEILFLVSRKFYFILVTYFRLSLRRAYFLSGFEPGSTVTLHMKIHFPPHSEEGPERAVGVATCYVLDVWGSNPGNSEFCVPEAHPSYLTKGTGSFSEVNRP